MTRYVALLRGINVGGKNIVKMAALREAFERQGFSDVATYIQSGNVIFRAESGDRAALAASLERALSDEYATEIKVVLLTAPQLHAVVEQAPKRFGDPAYRCDVIFLREPLTPEQALAVVETKEGVDETWAGPGVLYFSRLAARASSSRLSRIVARPEYKEMTIRTWRTVTKLAGLLERATTTD